jgi:hypothetical protein
VAKTTAKKPAKAKKPAPAKAKAAAKPSKAAAAPKAKTTAKAAAPKPAKAEKARKAVAAPKAEKPPKAEKAPKAKKDASAASSPTPTIMNSSQAEAPAAKPVKPKVDKAEARKARRAAKDLLAGLERLADARAKWEALYAKASDLTAEPYKMSGVYEPRTAIMHKVLGWGYILSAQNDRLEVLFKDGIKMLISNYKPA